MTAALERAKRAWGEAYVDLTPEEVERRARTFAAIVRGIARRGSVAPSDLAREIGIDTGETKQLLAALAAMGMEFDDAGNIVGAALTTKPTPHTLRVGDGETLYAWCALDTLFIPGLIGQAALVESICPVSGEAIRLSVAPEGVAEWAPETAVVSVFLPSASAGRQTGPASPT